MYNGEYTSRYYPCHSLILYVKWNKNPNVNFRFNNY